jgi:hypothetical protein
MKILLVNDYPVPVGGAEIQSLFLKEELRKRGHDARIFSTSAHLSAKGYGRLPVFWDNIPLSYTASGGKSTGILETKKGT